MIAVKVKTKMKINTKMDQAKNHECIITTGQTISSPAVLHVTSVHRSVVALTTLTYIELAHAHLERIDYEWV